MQLRFYARGADLVSVPGERRMVGQPARYVGRSFKAGDSGHASSYPASESAHECDADSEAGKRLCKLARDGSLWPADEQTAEACSVPFVEVSFSDGEWLPVVRPKLISPARGPSKGSKD